jgi:hypothetical protein
MMGTIPVYSTALVGPPIDMVPMPGTKLPTPSPYQRGIGIDHFVANADGTARPVMANGQPWVGPTTAAQVAVFTGAGAAPISPSVQLSVPGYRLQNVPAGAPFSLAIGGAGANQPINVQAVINGQTQPIVPLGSTDLNGNLTLTGTMPASPGTYVENYSVQGGGLVGSVSFMIAGVSNAPASVDPTTTINTPFAQPRTQSGSQPPTTLVTVPADSRGTGYGTLAPGTPNTRAVFSLGAGVPFSAVPVGTPFTVDISGAPPGSHVQFQDFINGVPIGAPSDLGVADSSGALVVTGNMPSGPLGFWNEAYSVAGVTFGMSEFTLIGGQATSSQPVVSSQQFGTSPNQLPPLLSTNDSTVGSVMVSPDPTPTPLGTLAMSPALLIGLVLIGIFFFTD